MYGRFYMEKNIGHGSDAGGDRFDRVEAILRRYPAIEPNELAELKHWCNKTASAFELASLASKDDLREPYARLREDHLDRLSFREIAVVTIIIVLLVGLFGLIA